MLSKFEHEFALSSKENENENKLSLKADETHKLVIAIERFTMKYCKTVLHLFIRVSDSLMIADFKSKLKMIFAENYKIENLMYFDTHSIQ